MSPKNLISLNNWSIGDIKNILNLALNNLSFKSDLSGKLLINLFFENSTRTRVSFEIAAKRLGMHVINVNSSTSSVKKGETLLDTLETLQALSPDIIVFRHNGSGAADFIAQNINCPVINAGDGSHAHPTQALLDAFTIQQAKGRIAGLIVAICGDILHSRVARSNIICLSKLGAKIRLIAPSTLLPYNIENMGLEIYHDMKSGLKDVDVIMMLRMQKERMELAFVPSIREYHHFYGLTNEALNYAKNDCIIMHPGPINRDAEIASQVTKDKKCHILQQVSHGVAVRMAVIETLLQDDEND